MYTSEVGQLRDEFLRLRLPAHAHTPDEDEVECVAGEVCITEEGGTFARIIDGSHRVYTDTMTAQAAVSVLPDDAPAEDVWAELASYGLPDS